eukprot:scaffold21157_cov67-Phaeocystis_antarctica.AAC.1
MAILTTGRAHLPQDARRAKRRQPLTNLNPNPNPEPNPKPNPNPDPKPKPKPNPNPNQGDNPPLNLVPLSGGVFQLMCANPNP